MKSTIDVVDLIFGWSTIPLGSKRVNTNFFNILFQWHTILQTDRHCNGKTVEHAAWWHLLCHINEYLTQCTIAVFAGAEEQGLPVDLCFLVKAAAFCRQCSAFNDPVPAGVSMKYRRCFAHACSLHPAGLQWWVCHVHNLSLGQLAHSFFCWHLPYRRRFFFCLICCSAAGSVWNHHGTMHMLLNPAPSSCGKSLQFHPGSLVGQVDGFG